MFSNETTTALSVHDLSGLSQRTTLGGGRVIGGEKALTFGRYFTGDATGVGYTIGNPVVGTTQGIYSIPIWSDKPPPLNFDDFDLSSSNQAGGMCRG